LRLLDCYHQLISSGDWSS